MTSNELASSSSRLFSLLWSFRCYTWNRSVKRETILGAIRQQMTVPSFAHSTAEVAYTFAIAAMNNAGLESREDFKRAFGIARKMAKQLDRSMEQRSAGPDRDRERFTMTEHASN